MTAPMPANAPTLMRDHAALDAMRHACAEMVRDHDQCAVIGGLSICPCVFCRTVRPFLAPMPQVDRYCTEMDEREVSANFHGAGTNDSTTAQLLSSAQPSKGMK